MHVPDGLMAPAVLLAGWLLAMIVIAIATKTVNKRIDERQIPFMAVLAAGIFVAQMLNFPIGGGTTGHLVGAALAAILLGPYAGMLVITTILVIQCLLFGDGGVTALGLNVFNMGILGCLIGWYSYRLFPDKHRNVGIFVASWCAVLLGALACALELALSYDLSNGAYGINGALSIPTMLVFHVFIGLGEAIITTGVIVFLATVAPDIIRLPKITPLGVKVAVV